MAAQSTARDIETISRARFTRIVTHRSGLRRSPEKMTSTWLSRSHSQRDERTHEPLRAVVVGEGVRDWRHLRSTASLYSHMTATAQPIRMTHRALRCCGHSEPILRNRSAFGGRQRAAAGLHWWEYMQLTTQSCATPLSIAFAFVATHNHFVFDRGGKVFKRSAPVIKLPEGATEDEHLALLGVLNSSTACFWLKQNSHDKGIRGERRRFTPIRWERFLRVHWHYSAGLSTARSSAAGARTRAR